MLGAVVEQVGDMDPTHDRDLVDPRRVRDAERILTPLVGSAFTTQILRWAEWSTA